MAAENYAIAAGIPDICSFAVEPCPKCGSWMRAYGKPCSVGTPKLVRWYRAKFKHGVTCVCCGYYAPSVKSWNRGAGNDAQKSD